MQIADGGERGPDVLTIRLTITHAGQMLVGETASTLIGKEAQKKLLINLWAVLRSKLVDLMALQGASGSQRMYDAIVLQDDPSP